MLNLFPKGGSRGIRFFLRERCKKTEKTNKCQFVCMYVGRKQLNVSFSFCFFPNNAHFSSSLMVAWEKTEKCQFLWSRYVCQAKTNICQFIFLFFFVHLPLRCRCWNFSLSFNIFDDVRIGIGSETIPIAGKHESYLRNLKLSITHCTALMQPRNPQ